MKKSTKKKASNSHIQMSKSTFCPAEKRSFWTRTWPRSNSYIALFSVASHAAWDTTKLIRGSNHGAVWETLMEWLMQMLAEPADPSCPVSLLQEPAVSSSNSSSHCTEQDVSGFHMAFGWHTDPSWRIRAGVFLLWSFMLRQRGQEVGQIQARASRSSGFTERGTTLKDVI